MKWMLVIVVMGAGPVKTDLTFDTLQECLDAEDKSRREVAAAYNRWIKWASANPEESGYPDSEKFMQARLGMANKGTCIPHTGR